VFIESQEERLILKLSSRLGQVAKNSMLESEGLKAYLKGLQKQQKESENA
jgi:hypothetical protein